MINWEDERGKALASSSGHLFSLVLDMIFLVPEADLAETKCLQFIMPYADTTFNQKQIPVLIEELEMALRHCSDAGKRAEFEEVVRCVRQAEGRLHTYVKMYGD